MFYKFNLKIIQKEIVYLVFILIWIGATFLLNTPDESNTFRLNPLVQLKIVLAAIIFLGRELFFPVYHHQKRVKIFFIIILIPIFGLQFAAELKHLNFFHSILILTDSALWSFCGAIISDLLVNLFLFWSQTSQPGWSGLSELWVRCWQEIFFLGLWMALLESFVYLYLINFYIVDTIFYSYLLAVFLWFWGIALFTILASKTRQWISRELEAIDRKIEESILWRDMTPDSIEESIINFSKWLLTIRNYLSNFKRPQLSLRYIIYYLLFSLFLLSLPYIFGVVIEV